MNKIIEVKGGGACISIEPMTEWDFAAVFHGREMLILENCLDGKIRRGYNPSIKPLTVNGKTKTSGKKQTAKGLKAKTINR
ncbi:MAG: hypothetical protein EBR82_45160 [Caulobacteraceae bacterium]|nr:hypothetical protein [Caulobacteraceae bacterium]